MMKLNPASQRLKSILALGISVSLLFAQPSVASGRSFKKTTFSKIGPGDEDPAKKNKSRSMASRNNSSVKIYPDALKRDMHVVAKDNNGKEIDFFVFGLDGTLIRNYKMKANGHYKLTGLARGLYIYRVFSGDIETVSGKFEIR